MIIMGEFDFVINMFHLTCTFIENRTGIITVSL